MVMMSCFYTTLASRLALFVPLREYLCVSLYCPRPRTDSPPRPRAARAGSARAAWRWTKALLRGSVGVNAWAPIRREDTKRADFMVASYSSSSGKGARVRTVSRACVGRTQAQPEPREGQRRVDRFERERCGVRGTVRYKSSSRNEKDRSLSVLHPATTTAR